MSAETNSALFAAIDAFNAVNQEHHQCQKDRDEIALLLSALGEKRKSAAAAVSKLLPQSESVVYQDAVYFISGYTPGNVHGVNVRPIAALRLES